MLALWDEIIKVIIIASSRQACRLGLTGMYDRSFSDKFQINLGTGIHSAELYNVLFDLVHLETVGKQKRTTL